MFRAASPPFVPTTTGPELSVVVPNGIQAGDIAYLWGGLNTGTATATDPPGWTLISGPIRAGSTISGWLWRKVLVGNEGGTTVTSTFSASGRRHGGMVVLTSGSIEPGVMTPWNDTTADRAISIPAFTPQAADAQVMVIAMSRYPTTNGTVTFPAGYTEVMEGITNYAVPNFSPAAAYKQLVGGPTAQPAQNGVYTQNASTIGWVFTHAPDAPAPPASLPAYWGLQLEVPAAVAARIAAAKR